MARVKDEGDVLSGHPVLEFLENGRQLGVVRIGGDKHFELQAFQLGRHIGGVVDGIGESGDVLVGGIANDQRNALGSLRCPNRLHRAEKKENQEIADQGHSRHPRSSMRVCKDKAEAFRSLTSNGYSKSLAKNATTFFASPSTSSCVV